MPRFTTVVLAATLFLAPASAVADPLILHYPDRSHMADRSDYQFWILRSSGLHPTVTIKLRAGFYGVTIDCQSVWDQETAHTVSAALTARIAEATTLDLLPLLKAVGLNDCEVDY